MSNRGFTVIELMVVVVIIGILLTFAIANFRAMSLRLDVEGETKGIYTTLMNSRLKAMEKNQARLIVLSNNSYQVWEDRNNNGVPDASDQAIPPTPTTLKYAIQWNLFGGGNQLTLDRRGVVFPDGSIHISMPPVDALDCVTTDTTRIYFGKWNGTTNKCDRR